MLLSLLFCHFKCFVLQTCRRRKLLPVYSLRSFSPTSPSLFTLLCSHPSGITCACRCVFMQCALAYSPMYLYFSPSLQASLLLHQSSIFQIKWSWLKECKCLIFQTHERLHRDSTVQYQIYITFLYHLIMDIHNISVKWIIDLGCN